MIEEQKEEQTFDLLKERPMYEILKIEILKKLRRQRLKEIKRQLLLSSCDQPTELKLLNSKAKLFDSSEALTKLLQGQNSIGKKFRLFVDNELYLKSSEKLNSSEFQQIADARKTEFQAIIQNFTEKLGESFEQDIQRSFQKSTQPISSILLQPNYLIEILAKDKTFLFQSLKTMPCEFFPLKGFPNTEELFAELDYEKYEHLEQKNESESVETERIAEGSEILEELEKSEDPEEVLSFFKGGVPHDLRAKMYLLYYQTCEKKSGKIKPKVDNFMTERNSEAQNLIEFAANNRTPFEELINFQLEKILDMNEYFPYEAMIKRLVKYYTKHFQSLLEPKDKFNFGFLPFGLLCSSIAIASVFSSVFKTSQIVFKLLFSKISLRMLDLDFENSENAIFLLQFFETRFVQKMNGLFLHLKFIGFDPLKIASGWIFELFVGHLPMNEVLMMVDRILGFESLILLPLVSLGIFKHFEEELMSAENEEECLEELYLGDLEFIKLINLALEN